MILGAVIFNKREKRRIFPFRTIKETKTNSKCAINFAFVQAGKTKPDSVNDIKKVRLTFV